MNQTEIYSAQSEAMLAKKAMIKKIYPWLVWILAATFFFYKYVIQVSPSVMSADLMRTFSITGAGLGNLAACFFYAYLVMQIPVGLLLDRWSPRLITAFAIFVCALGTFLFSKAETLFGASISRAVMGFGAAFAAVSCFKLASIWFSPKRFALVAGLSMTAGMLGAVGGQAPLAILVESFGWRSAMMCVGIAGFVLMILVLLLVRDRASNEEEAHHHASLLSQLSLWKQLTTVLKNQQTWLLSFYSGLAFAPVSVFGGLWGVSFLEQTHDLTPIAAASAVSFIFIGFAIGCPIAGWFSDFIKQRKNLMIIGTVIALITILLVLYLPSYSLLTLNLLLLTFGLGSSCFFLCFSMVREIHPIIFAATVLGFMNTFDSVCEALTEPLIGKLLDLGWDGMLLQGARLFSSHDYHMALFVLPLFFMLALIFLFFIKETSCVQKV